MTFSMKFIWSKNDSVGNIESPTTEFHLFAVEIPMYALEISRSNVNNYSHNNVVLKVSNSWKSHKKKFPKLKTWKKKSWKQKRWYIAEKEKKSWKKNDDISQKKKEIRFCSASEFHRWRAKENLRFNFGTGLMWSLRSLLSLFYYFFVSFFLSFIFLLTQEMW